MPQFSALPLLSGGHGVSPRGFWYSWAEEPLLTLAVFAAAAAYTVGLSRMRAAAPNIDFPRWRVWCYAGGVLAFVIAILSPVAAYSEELFFMHMVQHILLLLIAPPLILLGTPLLPLLRALPRGQRIAVARLARPGQPLARVSHWLTQPIVAVVMFVGSIAVWHIPHFYDAAQGRTFMHDLEHAMFHGAALLYWWPIVYPARGRRRLSTGWSFPYLLPPFLEGMLIGALLTFAGSPVYESYAALDARPIWGFNTLQDQELGGLIMWVPGGMFILIPLIGSLVRLVHEDNAKAVRPSHR
jgi:cytochrome c oxidase assembly factor CtaG